MSYLAVLQNSPQLYISQLITMSSTNDNSVPPFLSDILAWTTLLNLFPFFKARSNITFFDKSYLIMWPHTQSSTSPPCSPPKLNVPPTCFYSAFYIPLLHYSAHCIEVTCLHISPQKNKLYHILLMFIQLAPNMVPSTNTHATIG